MKFTKIVLLVLIICLTACEKREEVQPPTPSAEAPASGLSKATLIAETEIDGVQVKIYEVDTPRPYPNVYISVPMLPMSWKNGNAIYSSSPGNDDKLKLIRDLKSQLEQLEQQVK